MTISKPRHWRGPLAVIASVALAGAALSLPVAAEATAISTPTVEVNVAACPAPGITVDVQNFPAIQQAKDAVYKDVKIIDTPYAPAVYKDVKVIDQEAQPAVPATYAQEYLYVQKNHPDQTRWAPKGWNGIVDGTDNGQGWVYVEPLQHRNSSTVLTPAIPAKPEVSHIEHQLVTPEVQEVSHIEHQLVTPAVPAESNEIKVTLDGNVVENNTPFGTSFHKEFTVSGDVAHAYRVQVTNWQDPSNPITKSGTTVACSKPVAVKSTGMYLYKKLDASKPASWENSGKQTRIATWDGWSWPTHYPGVLPSGVCGNDYGVQVDEINGPQSLLPLIVDRATNTGVLGSPVLVASRHYDLSAVMAVPACTPPVITIPTPESWHQTCTAGNLTGENGFTVPQGDDLIASITINSGQPIDVKSSDYVNGVYIVHVGDNWGEYHLSYRRANGQPIEGKMQTTWDFSFPNVPCLPAKPAPVVVTTHVTTTSCAAKTATTKTTVSSTGWMQGPTSWTKGPTVVVSYYTTVAATAEQLAEYCTAAVTVPVTTVSTGSVAPVRHTAPPAAQAQAPLQSVSELAHTSKDMPIWLPWLIKGAVLAILLGIGLGALRLWLRRREHRTE